MKKLLLIISKNWHLILLCITPTVCAMIFCALNNSALWQIYLPYTRWDDELLHFKQIEAMVNYGYPQGYFGYLETPAALLTFGTWSPVGYLPYVLFGVLFGWTFTSPIWCNLLMITLAIIAFCFLAKPSVKSSIFFIGFYAAFVTITRYNLSIMTESVFFASFIILAGLSIYAIQNTNIKFCAITWMLLGFYLTLVRPNYVFVFIPLLIILFYRKNIWLAVSTCALIIISVFLFSKVFPIFSAPYLAQMLRYDFFERFSGNGIVVIIDNFVLDLNALLQWIFMCCRMLFSFDTDTNINGVTYIIAATQVVLLQINAARYFKAGKRNIAAILVFGTSLMVVYTLAVWFLYIPSQTIRYLMPAALFCSILITYYCGWRSNFIQIFITIIVCGISIADTYVYKPPIATAQQIEYNSTQQATLKSVLPEIDKTDFWANTILWTEEKPFEDLFLIPAGYGINMFSKYDFKDIKSQFIYCKNSGAYSKFYRETGCIPVYENETIAIFKNPYF